MSRGRAERLVEARDLKIAALLLLAAPVAWLLSARFWPFLTAPVGRQQALFEPPTSPLPPRLLRLLGGNEGAALARLRQSYIEDCMLTLRAWAPWNPRIAVELAGREALETALAGGRGAIVWVAPTACAPLIAKMALAEAGFGVTHLSRASHRFATSRLGVAVLNRVQTRIEDRYLLERMTVNDEKPTSALLRLRRRLAEGGVVSITAGGPASETVEAQFLGGCLLLPTGALRLSLMARSPVLPLTVVQTGPAAFLAYLEPALTLDAEAPRHQAYETAAREWCAALERRLEEHPEAWQGWMG